jgi:hypothetical protein
MEDAVSICRGVAVKKVVKVEENSWPSHARLSIEDPFERDYDVAHPVKKQTRFEWIRTQFLRAHSLIADAKVRLRRGDVRPPNPRLLQATDGALGVIVAALERAPFIKPHDQDEDL